LSLYSRNTREPLTRKHKLLDNKTFEPRKLISERAKKELETIKSGLEEKIKGFNVLSLRREKRVDFCLVWGLLFENSPTVVVNYKPSRNLLKW